MSWSVEECQTLLKTIPFDVEEIELAKQGKRRSHSYFRLSCGDWVNVLPMTVNREAILVRQFRAGPEKYVLETPGGVVERKEAKDPTTTAIRELEEETGYVSPRAVFLGAFNPNPAIQTNRIFYFFCPDCRLASPRKHFPDLEEEIEVVLTPVNDLDMLVRTGRIDHGLSALCIMLARKYLDT